MLATAARPTTASMNNGAEAMSPRFVNTTSEIDGSEASRCRVEPVGVDTARATPNDSESASMHSGMFEPGTCRVKSVPMSRTGAR